LTEAGRPQDSTPLAADDMIGSLATRVRELSLRVAQLEGELEAARRRVAVYEDFDEQVQDSLSAALRAANQIRERARVTAEAIAEEQELSKKQAEAILNDMVGRITKHLKKGDRIRIVGLGILQVRKRAARMGRNPATGEAIHIKASKKVAFRAAKELKEAV
jgi:DNA-binding protein HU-beta